MKEMGTLEPENTFDVEDALCRLRGGITLITCLEHVKGNELFPDICEFVYCALLDLVNEIEGQLNAKNKQPGQPCPVKIS